VTGGIKAGRLCWLAKIQASSNRRNAGTIIPISCSSTNQLAFEKEDASSSATGLRLLLA